LISDSALADPKPSCERRMGWMSGLHPCICKSNSCYEKSKQRKPSPTPLLWSPGPGWVPALSSGRFFKFFFFYFLQFQVRFSSAGRTRSQQPRADPWSEQDFIPRSGSIRLNEPSAQSQELYRSKTAAWSTQELEKLANLAEMHRTAKSREQWTVLEREFSSSPTHDDPMRKAESLRAAYRRFIKTSVRTSGECTQRAEVHSMERVEENLNDLSSEGRRPSRVSSGQMNINHAYDSAMSDGVTTAQQTLIISTSGNNETTSASSAHETELPQRKRATWS
uniref:Myb-like domain-containing protein n=1 Tax=Haemonchus placei TaxID=6290 RepID=A0A0N4WF81_HAEPC